MEAELLALLWSLTQGAWRLLFLCQLLACIFSSEGAKYPLARQATTPARYGKGTLETNHYGETGERDITTPVYLYERSQQHTARNNTTYFAKVLVGALTRYLV